MNTRSLLRIGIVGSVVAALCCFTPMLAVLAGLLGLGAVGGATDAVLVPVLAGFVLLTIYAARRRRRERGAAPTCECD
jgi:mercuric ion transport protein